MKENKTYWIGRSKGGELYVLLKNLKRELQNLYLYLLFGMKFRKNIIWK